MKSLHPIQTKGTIMTAIKRLLR